MDKLLTMQEICDCLQISRSTVNRLVTSGEIAAFKVGGQLRFKETDVELYLRSAKVGAPDKLPRRTIPEPPRRTVKIGRSTYDAAEPFKYVPGMKVV